MKKYFAIFIIFFFALTNIKSDDGFLGSRGGNVFPIIRNESIRMAKEEIRVVMEYDSCVVYCKFWFQNLGSKNENVYMGFPDYYQYVSGESIALRGFTCNVNSQKTEFEKMTQITQYDSDTAKENVMYDKWYCWTVNFKPLETILVENSYVGKWGGSADGTCSFSYLIGTAQTWSSTIGKGKVIFDYSKIASKLFVDTAFYSDSTLSTGLKRTIYNDSTVFCFDDYLPKWDEMLTVKLLCYWGSPFGDFDKNEKEYPFAYNYEWRDKYLSKQSIRLMRNEIYARHGYIFKDLDLQNYFSKQSWYKPDKDFDISRINSFENSFIKYLKDIENK